MTPQLHIQALERIDDEPHVAQRRGARFLGAILPVVDRLLGHDAHPKHMQVLEAYDNTVDAEPIDSLHCMRTDLESEASLQETHCTFRSELCRAG
jgi:hypothetical protein